MTRDPASRDSATDDSGTLLPTGPLHLFEATGVEIEYMIVDGETLDVRPEADLLLGEAAGEEGASEVEKGPVVWGNELVLHLVELKTAGPVAELGGTAERFHGSVREINGILAGRGARLLPTGMHPWMDPDRETRLWPHEYGEVYDAFDRIFGCQGHGWSNLQSVHVNLPFFGDAEFARLHAAVRTVLPILPALAASSPFADGRPTGFLDTRLEAYRGNARRVPSVAGDVIPEPVGSRAEYEERILARIYADLAPLDPDGVLRHEWVNARGCIARFDRGSVEIRVLDVQECPAADLAVAAAVVAAVRGLAEEALSPLEAYRNWPAPGLVKTFLGTLREGDAYRIVDPGYLKLFGYERSTSATSGELWAHLVERTLARASGAAEWAEALELILSQGCLARRIRKAAGEAPSRAELMRVYALLGDSLDANALFKAPS